VQSYKEGHTGFCSRCKRSIVGPVEAHPCANGRKLWIVEVENMAVMVQVDGEVVETESSGWTRRFVSGSEVYTKTVRGKPVLLHRIEAAARGVDLDGVSIDRTAHVPSASPPPAVQKAPKAIVADLSDWADMGRNIAKAAVEFGDRAKHREALRKKHVAQYKK